jgi:methionyl-tRNA formyltransferase
MGSLQVIFLGNDPWSVPTLEALVAAADIDVSMVVTNPPRPAGRGSHLMPTAVAATARRIGLKVLEIPGVRSGPGPEAIEEAQPDALVVVAYGEILSAEILEIPRLGSVNLHFSLLPRWRGAAPVQRAILEGDEITGVSVMLLDEGLDTGPVLAALPEKIRDDDDKASLGQRLATLGAPLVIDALRALDAGTAAAEVQEHDGVTYAAKLAADERVIHWGDDAHRIVRQVRAHAPAPGATTTFRGDGLKVLRARADGSEAGEGTTVAGELRVGPDGAPAVVAEGGSVCLLEVAPAGRARMSGAEWARGARIERGECLS